MRFGDSLNLFAGGRSITASSLYMSVLLAALLASDARAQTAPAPQATAKLDSSLPVGDTWLSLTKAQKVALAPLENSWPSLSAGSREKWRVIAKTFPDLAAPEQEKLHSRMAEWAALSPKDRELARLNFAQSKSVTKSDRAANWEAYQALSPDEREQLAQRAKRKTVGAAIAVKPVAPDKLTAVPVTRHTPEQERAIAIQQRLINRNTLLPQTAQLPGNAPSATAVVAPVKP
jgi:hypothetical protein